MPATGIRNSVNSLQSFRLGRSRREETRPILPAASLWGGPTLCACGDLSNVVRGLWVLVFAASLDHSVRAGVASEMGGNGESVGLYEQHRSPSRLDKCLDLVNRPVSVEQMQAFDMCHILQREAKLRGFELRNITMSYKGKPTSCKYNP